MPYLSKLIVKEWVKTFLVSFLVLVALSMTGDLINGLLRNKDSFNEILINYLIKLPSLLTKIIPITSLLATLFTFNKLKGQSELIAILAAGFSPARIYLLVFSLSSAAALLQFYNATVLDPLANQKKLNSEDNSNIKTKLSDGKIWYKGLDYVASFSAFDPQKNTLYDLSIYHHDTNYLLKSITRSNRAVYIDDYNWRMINTENLTTLNEKKFPNENLSNEIILKLSERPSDFKQIESDINTLKLHELISYIFRVKSTGLNINGYLIILFDKFSLALICLVFGLFPLSTIFEPNRRSSSFGKNVVFTLVFTVLFWMIYSSMLALGNKGKIHAFFATHLIPILFLIHIVFVFYKRKKL